MRRLIVGGLAGVGLTLIAIGVFLPHEISWAHGSGDTVHFQCERPVGDTLKVTINGGKKFAEPGEVFGFDIEELALDRCQPVEITFINHDEVRHAFMIDGMSPMVMLELPGQGQMTTTFVAPDEDATLLLHCHVPGHDRAGMNGSVSVGSGDVAGFGNSTTNGWANTAWLALALMGGFVIGSVGVWTWASLK